MGKSIHHVNQQFSYIRLTLGSTTARCWGISTEFYGAISNQFCTFCYGALLLCCMDYVLGSAMFSSYTANYHAAVTNTLYLD